MADLLTNLTVESARLARRAADTVTEATGRQRWVVGALGPTTRTASISPDVNDPGARNISYDQFGRGLPRAGQGPGRRRRRRAPRRDHLRHPQCQRRLLCSGRSSRRRVADGRSSSPARSRTRSRTHPVRSGDRGLLVLDPSCPAARRRSELCARRRRTAALMSRNGAAGRLLRQRLPQRRSPQRLR